MNDLEKKSIECIKNMPIEETTYQVARNVVLDYITNLQEENENRISESLSYDLLNAKVKELEKRNEKAIEYINKFWKKKSYYEDVDNCMKYAIMNEWDKSDLLNILQGEDKDE